MQWDWSRVNPKGGMTATMAKVLVAVMLVTFANAVYLMSRQDGAPRWVSVGSAVLSLGVAAWITAAAAGLVRRP